MTIIHQQRPKSRFVAMDGEREAGEMLYTMTTPEKLVILHTEVDPAFAGRGIGKQLVMAAVTHARENGMRIVPLCPFAKGVFRRIPEWRDVLV